MENYKVGPLLLLMESQGEKPSTTEKAQNYKAHSYRTEGDREVRTTPEEDGEPTLHQILIQLNWFR